MTALVDGDVKDNSDNNFKIKPVMKLTNPVGSEELVVGSVYRIKWDQPDGAAPQTDIWVSTNGGLGADTTAGTTDDFPNVTPNLTPDYGGIVASDILTTAGYYDWTVPNIMTNQGIIRICKDGEPSADLMGIPTGKPCDVSPISFVIKGSITNVHIKNAALDSPPNPGSACWDT